MIYIKFSTDSSVQKAKSSDMNDLGNKYCGKLNMKMILIVEDDIYISNMLYERLKQEGYEIYNAYSGTEVSLFNDTILNARLYNNIFK